MKSIAFLTFLAALPAYAGPPHARLPGGPYDQPYAIITSDRAPGADPNLRYVVVNRVDGESVGSDNRAVVAPGKREITVDLPPRKGLTVATQRTLTLQASPCMRYYVMAKLATPVGEEWSPVVRSAELIGECQTKFRTFEVK